MNTTCETTAIQTLVVEDDDQDFLLLRRQLQRGSHPRIALDRARSLADMLTRLRAQPYQILLLDLCLPDSSGLETVRRVVAQTSGLPIIVLTGGKDEVLGAEVVQLGAQDYLPKEELAAPLLTRSIAYALERHRAMAAASHAALHDALTRLPNRVLFQDRLENAMEACERQGKLLALAYFDLDGFKPINDNLGHPAGDQVLRQVADRFRAALRTSDTAARLGGDEFACILPAVSDAEAARNLADKLRLRISGPYRIAAERDGASHSARLGASVGVALFPRDATRAGDLLARADQAMYQAKHQGGDAVVMAGAGETMVLPREAPPTCANPLSVLLVDDDAEDRRLIAQTLLASGEVSAPLLQADSLAQGIALARRRMPDVVLLDLNLGDSQGLSTLYRFLDATPPLPVVVLTGVNDRSLAQEALRRGAQDYLPKDWRYRELWVRSLLHAVERQQLLRRLSRAEEREQLANTDLLTGLANRRRFCEQLAELSDGSAIGGDSFALLFIDLRHFKAINEIFGHSIGDKVLSLVADIFTHAVRDSDILARIGGDEFAVILPGVENIDGAEQMACALVEAVSKPLQVDGHRLTIGATAGIAIGPKHATEPDGLLSCADMAMLAARREDEDCAIYTQALGEAAQRRLMLERDLRTGLEREELVLHFQPVTDPANGLTADAEALVRWQHPRLGLLAPDQFIPIAENCGLIQAVDDWVLRNACLALALLSGQSADLQRVAVNISGRHFADGSLTDRVDRVLKETGVAPRQLKLEVTETALVENARQAIETMQTLKALGVSLALDDFGVEYSSLSYLRQFPVDIIKVDRSFVACLHENPRDRAIVESVIDLAQRLGLQVVIEGVETQKQLDWCREWPDVRVQGYLISRPLASLAAALGCGCEPTSR